MIKKAFSNGLRLTLALWWLILLQIVLGLGSVVESWTKQTSVSWFFFFLSLVLTYLSLGFMTAKILIFDRYTKKKIISPDYVFSAIKNQANRLLIPLFSLGCLSALIGFIVVMFAFKWGWATRPTPEASKQLVQTLMIPVSLLFGILTAILASFPIYFALEKKSFIHSIKQATTYAWENKRFTASLIGFHFLVTLVSSIMTSVVGTQTQLLSLTVINTMIDVYLGAVVYEYWKKQSAR